MKFSLGLVYQFGKTRGITQGSLSLLFLLVVVMSQFAGQHGVQGQGGMVALPDQNDNQHNKEPPLKPLSKEKVEAHMKIASKHLHEVGGGVGVGVTDDDSSVEDEGEPRVTRTDKPSSLQNPAKHAAEEFVLQFLLKQYPKSTNPEEQVEILQNLENFSHKFENGRDLFRATNALKDILLPALNSSNQDVRNSACGVFAIASQNNKDVQDVAVEAGVLRPLIHLIAFDTSVRSRALFALSSLVRNFPKGQAKFVKDGGVPALVKVASFSETRKRSLKFVTDLLMEREYCRLHGSVSEDMDPCDDLKLLETSLQQSGWCDILTDSITNIPGFDLEDQILIAESVLQSLPFCEKSVSQFIPIFEGMLLKLEKDDDFREEATLVRNVIDRLHHRGDEGKQNIEKEEL